MSFKPIETQEELDRIIQDRLNRQKEKFSDYDEIKSQKEALEQQVTALNASIEETKISSANFETQIADLNQKIAGYETTELRTRIALQNGIPYELADMLTGNDEESIKANAERLAGFTTKQKTPPPMKNNEPKLIGEDEDADLRDMLKKINGNED